MYLPEKGYKKLFVITFYAFLTVFAIWFSLKYLTIVLFPFLISWVLAFYLQKPILFLNKKLHLPKKLSATLFIIGAICVTAFIFSKILNGIFSELSLIDTESVSKSVVSFFDSAGNIVDKYLPQSLVSNEGLATKLREGTVSALIEVVTGTLEKLPSLVTRFISFIPRLLIILVIFLFSSFYLSSDYVKINSFLISQFNKRASAFLIEAKNIFFEVVSKFLKAYLILYVITFFVMLAGLLLIGVRFAFIMAVIIATVDILPILGSGTVLIPWSIISVFSHDYALAIKLILLYVTITFIHQILEPRLIGAVAGIHPLASVLAIFTGYSIMGVFGMFSFPVLLIILKTLNDRGRIKLWKTKNAP